MKKNFCLLQDIFIIDPDVLKARLPDTCTGLLYISETDPGFAVADLGDLGDVRPETLALALGPGHRPSRS